MLAYIEPATQGDPLLGAVLLVLAATVLIVMTAVALVVWQQGRRR